MFETRQRCFPRVAASARDARDFTSAVLCAWDMTERLDDVCLCVSELATNALLYGPLPGQEFTLRLTRSDADVRVEVRDFGNGRPLARNPEVEDVAGRGLFLVRALADDYGIVDELSGKTVWLYFKTVG